MTNVTKPVLVTDLVPNDVIVDATGTMTVLSRPVPGGHLGRWTFRGRDEKGREQICAIQPDFEMDVLVS